MDEFMRHWLAWPSVEAFMQSSWGWPLCETAHFFGLTLLIGGVGIFDLRILGLGRGLRPSQLKQLLPWGVFGFTLCVVTGLAFLFGMNANIQKNAWDVIRLDLWVQLKLLFIALAGLNVAAFYLTGMARAVDQLGPNDDAPLLSKVIAGASLFLWTGVIYFGRLIPENLPG